MTGIEKAVKACGGQVKTAEQMGVTQQAVSLWVQKGFAPADRVVELEQYTGVPRVRLIDPRLVGLLDTSGL